MASMSLIAASVVSSFMLGTSAEVIPLDEVQHVLDSGVVAQSRSVVVGEDGTRWILEEVGADVRTERVIQRSGVEMPLPTPNARYFVGSVDGDLGSRVVLGFGPDLPMQGLEMTSAGTRWISTSPEGRPGLFDPADFPESYLPQLSNFCNALEVPNHGDTSSEAPRRTPEVASAMLGSPCLEVDLAIDTDQEFLGLFGGDAGAATAYVELLVLAMSEIFDRDAGTRFVVTYLRLWDDTDPWSAGNTGDELFAFREYWLANMTDVPRDLAHFLSGRGLGGGVAWLNVICNSDYGYALSANLAGFFPYPILDNNGSNWDLMVVTHETGHNCSAPHTHNVGIDQCGCDYGGCPGDPPPPTDCSAAQLGVATIMSYCHTCPGGIANMRMEFHPIIESDYLIPAINNASCLVTCPEPCPADVNGDTEVGFDDLVMVLADWGSCSGCAADIDASGVVDFNDLLVLLADFGPCEDPLPVGVSYYNLAGTNPSVLPDFSGLTPMSTGEMLQINLASTGGAFGTSGLSDDVGAVFTSMIDFPEAGVWTLYTESDDGSKLLVEGTLVVDNDGLHGMVEVGGTIEVTEPGPMAVRVEFFERGGGAGLIVRWEGPGVAKAVVPSSAWRPAG